MCIRDRSNLVALVVPKNDDYRVEAAMIKELESHDEVDLSLIHI